jgi:hypothetical protein
VNNARSIWRAFVQKAIPAQNAFSFPSSDKQESPAGEDTSICRESPTLCFDLNGSPSFLTAVFGTGVHDAIGCPKTTDPTGGKKSREIAGGIAVVRAICVHSDGASFVSGNMT